MVPNLNSAVFDAASIPEQLRAKFVMVFCDLADHFVPYTIISENLCELLLCIMLWLCAMSLSMSG